jgi:ABC-type Mn2+/Zn2+ transport system ATPase subunit
MREQNTISLVGLSHSYGNKRILTNVNLALPRGTLCGVIGPNGAGKSTLFKCMLQLIDYDFGQIELLGQEIDNVRKRVAYVPQKDEVDWTFPATVLDIVLMGRYPFKKLFQRLSAEDIAIAVNALKDLGIENLQDRQIGNLSGGQQQRVFIARALAQNADIYLLDEPFVGVDIATEQKIISILKKLASEGKTLLVVHHDLSTVPDYFDSVILINQRLIAAGKATEVFNDANIAKAYGGQLNILHKLGMKAAENAKSNRKTK